MKVYTHSLIEKSKLSPCLHQFPGETHLGHLWVKQKWLWNLSELFCGLFCLTPTQVQQQASHLRPLKLHICNRVQVKSGFQISLLRQLDCDCKITRFPAQIKVNEGRNWTFLEILSIFQKTESRQGCQWATSKQRWHKGIMLQYLTVRLQIGKKLIYQSRQFEQY